MAIRTFICIELPPAIHESLGNVVAKLKPLGGRISWVRPENIHLTLAFLGDVAEERVANVNAAAASAAGGIAPFNVEVASFGVFANRGRPSVFWAGVHDEGDDLGQLATSVSRELARAGFPGERRPFTPHLTLGRVKDDRDAVVPRVGETLAEMKPEHLIITVDRVTVMRSELHPEGARYSHLGQFPLNG